MPAVTPSSSEWESLLDEAHEPSQEAAKTSFSDLEDLEDCETLNLCLL